MDAALMRALHPKITPQAAMRMHNQYVTGVAVTTATAGILWWTTFWQVWTDVYAPAGVIPTNAGGNATERSEGRVDHNVWRNGKE